MLIYFRFIDDLFLIFQGNEPAEQFHAWIKTITCSLICLWLRNIPHVYNTVFKTEVSKHVFLMKLLTADLDILIPCTKYSLTLHLLSS